MKALYNLLPKENSFEGEVIDWAQVVLVVGSIAIVAGYLILLITQ